MVDDFVKELAAGLAKIVDGLKGELAGIRSNRPTAKLVEDIKIDYFGQKLPLKQLASISVVPPREIQVSVWDKNAAGAVSKAIEEAKIGASVGLQENLVRVSLPPLSDERRQELVKLVKSIAENFRIRVRGLRDEINKKVRQAEEQKAISEDQRFKLQEQVQKSVGKANNDIEELIKNKIREIQS